MDFTNLNVLVIGDICLDVVEDGASTRLSPEAPVPVILNPTEKYSLGMSANVVLNLLRLGSNVDFNFIYGNDYYGNILESIISKELCVETAITESDIQTIVKKRIFANGHQIARLDYEHPVNEQVIIENMVDFLEGRINDNCSYDAIIISDYNKGTITKSTWMHIKPLLEQLGENFFVDTKKLNVLDFYKGMIIFPNTKEILELMEYNNLYSKNSLREKLEIPFIIETAGENGANLYEKNSVIKCKAYKEDIIDICGCGDTFMAAFVLYYSKFKNKVKSLDFANYCSSKVALKKGTSTVDINEVMDFSSFWPD